MNFPRHLFYCISLLLLTKNIVYAQEKENASFNSIFSNIYNMRFDEAEKELLISKASFENLKFEILYIDLNWWRLINCNNEENYRLFEKNLSQLKTKSKNTTLKNDLEELIFQSYYARLYAFKHQYLKLFVSYHRINNLINIIETTQLPPDQKEMFGLYRAIFSIKNDFLFSSKSQAAINQLQCYTLSDKLIIRTISTYFLAKTYYDIEKEPKKALHFFNELSQMYPGNTIFREYSRLCSIQ